MFKQLFKRNSCHLRITIVLILIFFAQNVTLANLSLMPKAAAEVSDIPVPKLMEPSLSLSTPLLRGMKVIPDKPLDLQFVVDLADKEGVEKPEAAKLVKYFLAALTIPAEELWVNLSPYEKDRIVPEMLGQTDLGKDLLLQDYLLKQITASLTYPENNIGKRFWERIYKKTYEKYGTTDLPFNTFNKVWVMPDKASLYEVNHVAYITQSRLKVLLEKDYVALEKNKGKEEFKMPTLDDPTLNDINGLSSGIVREIILPELEKEVNEGEHFATLRQIYNSIILALWYKQNLENSFLTKVYADKNKIAGVDIADKEAKMKIYKQYLAAFKKGVYNYIKEEYDPNAQEVIPRKYFSGGFTANGLKPEVEHPNKAMLSKLVEFGKGLMLLSGTLGVLAGSIPVAQAQQEKSPPSNPTAAVAAEQGGKEDQEKKKVVLGEIEGGLTFDSRWQRGQASPGENNTTLEGFFDNLGNFNFTLRSNPFIKKLVRLEAKGAVDINFDVNREVSTTLEGSGQIGGENGTQGSLESKEHKDFKFAENGYGTYGGGVSLDLNGYSINNQGIELVFLLRTPLLTSTAEGSGLGGTRSIQLEWKYSEKPNSVTSKIIIDTTQIGEDLHGKDVWTIRDENTFQVGNIAGTLGIAVRATELEGTDAPSRLGLTGSLTYKDWGFEEPYNPKETGLISSVPKTGRSIGKISGWWRLFATNFTSLKHLGVGFGLNKNFDSEIGWTRKESQKPEVSHRGPVSPSALAAQKVEPGKILVVSSEQIFQDGIKEMLPKYEGQIVNVSSVAQALEEAKREKVSVVITDFTSTEGLKLIIGLNSNPNIKVIVVTPTPESDRQELIKPGKEKNVVVTDTMDSEKPIVEMVEEKLKQDKEDQAVGGIDLQMQPSDINVKKEDQAMLQPSGSSVVPPIDLQNFRGFDFKIDQLVPLTSLESFLK